MKILVLCDVLFPQTTGGAGRVARELATALKKLGNEVQFLTRRTSNSPPDDDIKTIYTPRLGRALAGQQRKIFKNTIEWFNPDIVHIHQPLPAFLSIPATFTGSTVYTFHSSWPEELKIKSSPVPKLVREMAALFLSRIEKQVLSRADAIVVLSEYSSSELKRLYSLPSVLIPGGVDSKRFQPVETGRSNEDLKLVTLRNLVPRMGLMELIRALSLLPSAVRLDIGGEGPLRPALDDLIRSLGLGNRVRLLGHIPDAQLPRFYSGADWFVLPTVKLEGFGLVILESLSCGTPVLGTRVGAIPELLERFDSHWVIGEASPEAIASTLSSIGKLSPPNAWELHQMIAREFDWQEIARRYLDLFRSLL